MSDTATDRTPTKHSQVKWIVAFHPSTTPLMAEYPGSDLSLEEMAYALGRLLDVDSPSSRSDLLQLPTRKILDIGRDLRNALSVVDEIKNPLLPVNRLPTEILAEVLRYRANEKGLIAATHVCHYWRSCLLSTPSLWTEFRSRNPNLIRTYLERCKSAPISIDIPVTYDLDPFGYIIQHAAKVGSIHFDDSSNQVIEFLRHIRKPLLSLYSLELSTRFETSMEDLQTLPSEFLGPQAPSLRYLTLRGLYPPTHITFPSLSVLRLQFSGYPAIVRFDSVLASISRAPNLRELHVSAAECEATISSKVVTLGHLERFRLVMYGRPIHILPLMRLPRLRSLTLGVALYMDSPNFTLADFLPPSHCLSLTDADQMQYEVNSFEPPSRVVTFSTQHLIVTVFAHPSSHDTTQDLSFTDWLSDTSPVSLSQIKRVQIFGLPGPGEIPFAALENLEALQLRGSSQSGILVALLPSSGDGIVPCPRLRMLDVQWKCDVDVRELVHLVNLARERMARGSPFDSVRVAGSVTHQSSLIEELRGYVGRLDFF